MAVLAEAGLPRPPGEPLPVLPGAGRHWLRPPSSRLHRPQSSLPPPLPHHPLRLNNFGCLHILTAERHRTYQTENQSLTRDFTTRTSSQLMEIE